MDVAPRCPWDQKIVAEAGDTCSPNCYESFFIACGLSPAYIQVDDTPPKDLGDQPWYNMHTGRS